MLVLRKPYTSQPQTVAGIAGTQPQWPWSVAINFTDLANLGTAKDVQPVLKSGATLGPSLLKSAILGISGSAAYVELGTSTSIRANEYSGVFAFIPKKSGAGGALYTSRADANLGFVIYVAGSGQVVFDHRANIQLLATSNTVNYGQVNYLSFSFFGANPLTIRAVLNNVLSTNTRSFAGFTQGNAIIGRLDTTSTTDQPIDIGAFFLRPVAVRPNSGGDNQLFEWARNPWGLFVPQRKYIPVQIGAAAQTLTPSLFTNTQTFYSPTVTPGTVTLQPDLYTNTQSFYSPTVVPGAVTLTPDLYINTQAFYGPTVTQATVQTLLPDLFVNTNTIYPPVVDDGTRVVSLADVGAEDERRKKHQKRKDDEFERQKKEQERLRRSIEKIVAPVVEKKRPVVVSEQRKQVKVLSVDGAAIAIPVPPSFNAAEVAREVAQVFESARIEATRVQAQRAAAALEAARLEHERRLRKRRRDDELLLLM